MSISLRSDLAYKKSPCTMPLIPSLENSDKASFNWDCRVIPMDKSTEILAQFEAYCRELEKCNQSKFPDFKIVTELDHSDVPPLDTPEHLSIVPLIRELTGVDELTTVSYAAEAGQFHEAGYESIICGPGSIEQAHRANEFTTQEQLDKCVKMLEKLVVKFSV